MKEPLYSVGQLVAVSSMPGCCEGLTVIPRTTVIKIIRFISPVCSCGKSRAPPGWFYIVDDGSNSGDGFAESDLRPIIDGEYLDQQTQLERTA